MKWFSQRPKRESGQGPARFRPLLRHYRELFLKRLSIVSEYGAGTVSFIRWVPRLIKISIELVRGSANGASKRKRHDQAESLSSLPTYFINLDRRADRRALTEDALGSVGLSAAVRFPGVPSSLGILGCTQSHIGVLEAVKAKNNQISMVCEDDVYFLAGRDQISAVISEFQANSALDVLCLAYRLRAPRLWVSKNLAIGNSIQTASCYLIKQSAVDILLQSFRESEKMLRNGVHPRLAANDMHWKVAQTHSLVFAISRQRIARQRPSFSDVAGRHKDYRA